MTYTTRPILGGWSCRCTRCDRTTDHSTVASIRLWQDAHTCQRDAENRVTHRLADAVLASITPDAVSVILDRQRDLLTDTNWHDSRRAAA